MSSKRTWIKVYCKYCVHMYENVKMIPVETIPEMREKGAKGKCCKG
jgi:hypothetical protein